MYTMQNSQKVRMTKVIGMPVLFLVICAPALAADVTLSPASVTYEAPSESYTFTLEADGQPVAPGDVKATKIMVGEHDYDYMFDANVSNGKITLQPTDMLEIGSYDLVVRTSTGTAHAKLYAPLSDMEGTLKQRADELGVTVNQMKALLGLTSQMGREMVELDVAPVYHLGQKLVLAMRTQAGREYVWRIDGRVVQFGEGPHTFEHTFMDTGLYSITYTEYDNETVVAQDSHLVSVVDEPPVKVDTQKGRQVNFQGPAGYGKYVWRLDGQRVGTGAVLEHTFQTEGSHTVVCTATRVQAPGKQAFRKVAYRVDVE